MIFAINAVTAFFTPTFEASIPEIVGDEQYVKALSLSRVATDVEAVASPALAGLLVALLGVRWVFWFDSFTYLVSALLVLSVAMPHLKRVQGHLSLTSFLSEITHGTRVLLREPSLRQALTLSFAEATAGAAAIVVTVAYVRDVLGLSETIFAIVMAGLGLGSSVTAMILGRATGRYERGAKDRAVLHIRRHVWSARALVLGGIVLGLILLPGALKPPLMVFAVLWMLNGAGQALIAIPSSTLLAEHTAEHERGRAYAAHFALTHACWLITYPGVGHAAAKWGAPITFTAAGIVCLLVSIAAMALGRGTTREAHTHAKDGTPVLT
jgi:NRE family putative nickel resistance protein-like MFS transporter